MNVFFVCTGNACRSPLAACILKKKLKDRGIEASVASAGTLDWGRNPRDEFYVKLSKEKGYTLDGESRFIGDIEACREMDNADLVFIFEEQHRIKVERFLKYVNWDRITLFMDYCYGEKKDLDDPNNGTDALYRNVFDIIEKGCDIILDRIQEVLEPSQSAECQ